MKNAAAVLGILLSVAGGNVLPAQERIRKPPPFEPIDVLRLPPLQSHTFPNGLKLWIAARDPAPVMSLHLIIGGGECASPPQLPGLATLAATVLGFSTETRRPAEVEEAVEAIGGALTARAFPDVLRLGFHFLEENVDDALALVGDIILRPSFTERAFQIAKTTVTYDLLEKERDLEFAAKRLLLRQLFQGHPYERFAFSRDAIRDWTLKDLVLFIDRIVRPNNAQLLLVGNVNIDTASRKVSHVLNTWARRDPLPAPVPALRPPERDRLAFIDVPRAKDCAIYAGTTLPPLAAADSAALAVLNQIVGGTQYSRLFMNLRESNNYAYYAYSEIETYRAGEAFLVRAVVTTDVIGPAVVQVLGEVRRLAKEPPSAQEVEQAKGYLIGRFPVSIERPEAFSGRIADILSSNGGQDQWSRSSEIVIGVDAERTFVLAQRILAQPFLVVIAGAKEACQSGLSGFDEIDFYDDKGQFVSRQTKRKES